MLVCKRASYHDLSYDHRYAYLDDPEGIQHPRPVIVLLDAVAVLQAMQDDPERFTLQTHRLREIGSVISRSSSLEPPMALWWNSRFEIGDGRHRSAWLAHTGWNAIPFVTAEHMAEDLLRALGSTVYSADHYDLSQFANFPILDRESM